LLSLMLSGAVLAAPPWSDASNQYWVQTYGVTEVQVGNVAGGFPNGTFRPNQAVTRAEFAKMVVAGLGIATKSPAGPTFLDVAPGSTFYAYVQGAYAVGLVKGQTTPGGLVFGPNTSISRQQTNSILARHLAGKEIEATGVITGVLGGETPGRTFPSLDAWYAEDNGEGYLRLATDYSQVLPAHAVGTAYLIFREVVKGFGAKLDPTGKLSRAQAAAMVLRVKGVTFLRISPTVGDISPAHAASALGVRVTTPRGTSTTTAGSVYEYSDLSLAALAGTNRAGLATVAN
jgi:hypothetical protein